MATVYSIPNRPPGTGVPRSIASILADFDAVLSALNTYDGGNISAGTIASDALSTAAKARLGLSDAGTVRSGKSIIATSEARTNVAYGTLTTPDSVANLVLPQDGLIGVLFQATWQESVQNAARAAICLGANPVQISAPGAPSTPSARINSTTPNRDTPLFTTSAGLASAGNPALAYGADVTTGQIVGYATASTSDALMRLGNSDIPSAAASELFVGGPCYIFAAAGTYTVSVQFQSSSGTVTVKNRKLWVWSMTP